MHYQLSVMDLSQAQAWVVIIIAALGALGSLVVSIINAVKSKANGQKLDVINKKSDEIHIQTNSNLTSVKADLAIALKDIIFLKEFISKNTIPPPPPDPENDPGFIAKIELAPQTAAPIPQTP